MSNQETELCTAADNMHEAVATFLKDWRDGDFVLPPLAEIHLRHLEEKYLALGRAINASRGSS